MASSMDYHVDEYAVYPLSEDAGKETSEEQA
jgi:hypothetical protein